jgi:hypothetical protein
MPRLHGSESNGEFPYPTLPLLLGANLSGETKPKNGASAFARLEIRSLYWQKARPAGIRAESSERSELIEA